MHAAPRRDRLNVPHASDFALRHLALAAADADLTEPAAALVTFTETNLRPYRMGTPGQARLQPRLDRAMPGIADGTAGPPLHHGEVMAIVAELESAFTTNDADLPGALTTSAR